MQFFQTYLIRNFPPTVLRASSRWIPLSVDGIWVDRRWVFWFWVEYKYSRVEPHLRLIFFVLIYFINIFWITYLLFNRYFPILFIKLTYDDAEPPWPWNWIIRIHMQRFERPSIPGRRFPKSPKIKLLKKTFTGGHQFRNGRRWLRRRWHWWNLGGPFSWKYDWNLLIN